MIHGEVLVQAILAPDCNCGLEKGMIIWAKRLLLLRAGRFKGYKSVQEHILWIFP